MICVILILIYCTFYVSLCRKFGSLTEQLDLNSVYVNELLIKQTWVTIY